WIFCIAVSYPGCTYFPYTTLFRSFAYGVKLREGSFDQYEEDRTETFPLKFLVRGASYRFLGLVPSRLHLFGTETDRIGAAGSARSEEHTSELQSHLNLVCRLHLAR